MAEERDLKGTAPGAATSSAGDREIEQWRRRIDMIDEQLMRLLNGRSAAALEIGRIKRALGLPIYSPEREAWILDRMMRENPGPLDAAAVRRVFERIIDESRRLERLAGESEATAAGDGPIQDPAHGGTSESEKE